MPSYLYQKKLWLAEVLPKIQMVRVSDRNQLADLLFRKDNPLIRVGLFNGVVKQKPIVMILPKMEEMPQMRISIEQLIQTKIGNGEIHIAQRQTVVYEAADTYRSIDAVAWSIDAQFGALIDYRLVLVRSPDYYMRSNMEQVYSLDVSMNLYKSLIRRVAVENILADLA